MKRCTRIVHSRYIERDLYNLESVPYFLCENSTLHLRVYESPRVSLDCKTQLKWTRKIFVSWEKDARFGLVVAWRCLLPAPPVGGTLKPPGNTLSLSLSIPAPATARRVLPHNFASLRFFFLIFFSAEIFPAKRAKLSFEWAQGLSLLHQITRQISILCLSQGGIFNLLFSILNICFFFVWTITLMANSKRSITFS